MNLYDQFWQALDARRDLTTGDEEGGFEIKVTPVQPPPGMVNKAARDLAKLSRGAPRGHPPVLVSQTGVNDRPFCVIRTVSSNELPDFQTLFEAYLDKNAFIAETLLRLKRHFDISYVLFIGTKSFFLYDALLDELLRWGDDFSLIEELFFAPIAESRGIGEEWAQIPRKSLSQQSEEFSRWMELWHATLGARTNATPQFMTGILQKAVILFRFDELFGLKDADMRLAPIFLGNCQASRKRGSGNGSSFHGDFDGVAWLHQASDEVRNKHDLPFLAWTRAESSFFSLLGSEARRQFSKFILDLFLLSCSKFSVDTQADVFSDTDSRLKLWKYSVTEKVDIRKQIQADEINVYEPVTINLEESGIGWALCTTQRTLEFWYQRCCEFAHRMTERRRVELQYDMLIRPDADTALVPMPADAVELALSSSLKVLYEYPGMKIALEYLLILLVFEFCRQRSLPLPRLGSIEGLFAQKKEPGSLAATVNPA
ncbi:MAG: hypothetical protein WCK47_02720 [bacterium]|nr:hypothetical protein [Candidatus Sumerlaeota bacterium]